MSDSLLSDERERLLSLLLGEDGFTSARTPTITRRMSAKAKLSFSQQRLWFLEQFEPGSPAYNIAASVRLRGALNICALEQCISEIINRHEALRTVFEAEPGGQVQVITPAQQASLLFIDLSMLEPRMREQSASRLCHQEASRAFDLVRGPLIRITLLGLGKDEYIAVLVIHHIISDGWSIGIFIQDLIALYRAFAAGQASTTPALPAQYADYSQWQREHLQGSTLETLLNYWKRQLAQMPTELEIPLDRKRPVHGQGRRGEIRFTMPEALASGLKAATSRRRATLFMGLTAALEALLGRYSGQKDFGIGTPVANRNLAETESLIGFFVNTLVIRADLSADPSFNQLLDLVRQTTLYAFEHQDLPFEKLVEELQPERYAGRNPFFQVMLVLQNEPIPQLNLGNVSVSVDELDTGMAKFDLTLSMAESGDWLNGVLEYNKDLLLETTVARLLDHFQNLLQSALANPDQPLSRLSLLREHEIQQALLEWNDTESDYPKEALIHELFCEQAASRPDSIAIVFDDAHISYNRLEGAANQLARYLSGLGIGPDTLVGLCFNRSAEVIIATLAVLKAGGAYAPIDPKYPQQRLDFMLADTRLPALLTSSSIISDLPGLTNSCQVICLDLQWNEIERLSSDPLPNQSTADNLAYVIYTSGSTGEPKGVAVTHRAVARLVIQSNYASLTADEVFLQLAAFSFDASTFEIWGCLLNGAKLVIMPAYALSLYELSEALGRYQVTTLWLTAGLFHQFSEMQVEGAGSLRQLLAGGDTLLPSHARNVLTRLSGCRLINGYGPTESTTFACCNPMEEPARIGESVSIGRPISNTQAQVLNGELQSVPIGVKGELHIGGDGLARGYLNQPDLTALKFIPDPAGSKPGARLYKTGDIVRLFNDGTLDFLGRADRQVKIRGYRVEPGEIEAVLSKHPAVSDAAVMIADSKTGGKTIAAYAVADRTQATTREQLRRYLQERLPEYMLPSTLILMDAFPLTANGKVDRKALPLQTTGEDELPGARLAPRTPTEEIVAGIFASLLDVDQVSVDDNFFELGGHSLLATQAVSRIKRAFDIDLPLRQLFEGPTVASLSLRIETSVRAEIPVIAPALALADRQRGLELSFAQQRVWFLDQLDPQSVAYNIPSAVSLTGGLNVANLEQSLNEVIRRHETLRTTFSAAEGVPAQIINPFHPLNVRIIDLSSLDESGKKRAIDRLSKEDPRRPFDIESSPLLRVGLLTLDAQSHVVLVTMHHIVSDGWSVGLLNKEISAIYRAFSTGAQSGLPELSFQYADYAHWQRELLKGDFLAAQLSYWKDQLGGELPVLSLPEDRPRSAVSDSRGAIENLTISSSLASQLKRLSQQLEVTLFVALLSAFKALLFRYTGQKDLLVGSPIANRNAAEIEELIGFFVNTLVLRCELSGHDRFSDLVARVRRIALDAYTNQDLPFEKLVDELHPERSLSRSPLFQVMFVLQNTPAPALNLPGIISEPLAERVEHSKFDLALFLTERQEELSAALVYNAELYDQSTIKRFLRHYELILMAMITDSTSLISEVALLTEAERQQVLIEWNDTDSNASLDTCLPALLEARVNANPDAVAIIFDGDYLTFSELNRRANQLARYLRHEGIGPETSVAICMDRSVEMLIALWAVVKAGAAYMPIDPLQPADRISRMLEDGRAKAVLVSRETERVKCAAPVISLESDWATVDKESGENLEINITPENLAYIIFTSGSTGRPRGVMIAHRSVINLALALREKIYDGRGPHLKVSVNAPLSFDASVKQIIQSIFGHTLCIVPESARHDGEQMLSFIQANDIDVFDCTPSLLKMISCASGGDFNLAGRAVLVGGEALDESLWDALAKTHGTDFFNVYGPTECAVDSSLCLVSAMLERPVIGRAINNARTYALDDCDNPAPISVSGELHIAGAGLARGYIGNADLTADRFRPSPFGPGAGARMYKTGDVVAVRHDGNLAFISRNDDQLKVRGFRVEPGEIESALIRHQSVQAAVVRAWNRQPGDTKLVAYITTNQAEPFAAEQLRGYLKASLPDYMVPSVFALLERWPLTRNGKLDLRALPPPDSYLPDDNKPTDLRLSPAEQMLAEIWADVLGMSGIARDDNFFELGGHSLTATRAIARIRNAFEIDLPLRALFESPTIGGLAATIETSIRKSETFAPNPLAPVARDFALPLSYSQERLWLLNLLQPDAPHFNMASPLRIAGPLCIETLRQSLNEIVRRHEVLRTSFDVSSGNPVQKIAAPVELDTAIIDLSLLDEVERQSLSYRLAEEESRRSFNLNSGPVIRASILRAGEREHVLLFTMHHIASDGWSLSLLAGEAAQLHRAFLAGQPSPLAELKAQYADYAQWQRQALMGEALEAQLSFWRTQLSGDLPALNLPTDHPRPPLQSLRGARRSASIPTALARQLKLLSRSQGATLFMTLLTAFKVLLYRYTGETDIIVGAPIAGRHAKEIEDLIGFFVNTLVLRTDLSAEPTFIAALERVRAATLGAYVNQDLPFEMLLEDLKPKRELSRTPLFQVFFNMLNLPRTTIELPGLNIEPVMVTEAGANFDITLYVREQDSEIELELVYSPDLFNEGRICEMLAQYCALLSQIVSNPLKQIAHYSLLTLQARAILPDPTQELDDSWKGAVHDLFARQAQASPERLAVRDSQREWSYGQLDARSNQIAQHLRQAGIDCEDIVAIFGHRSANLIAAVMGALKAGAAFLILDPAYPPERLIDYLDLARPRGWIECRDAGLVPDPVAQFVDGLGCYGKLRLAADIGEPGDALASISKANPAVSVGPDNLAYISFTSGSTGRPKAIMGRHGPLSHFIPWQSETFGLARSDRYTMLSGLSHDPLQRDMFTSLCLGATLLVPDENKIGTPARLAEWMKDEAVTIAHLTPAMVQFLSQEASAASSPPARITSLRYAFIVGDALTAQDVLRFKKIAPAITCVNLFGATETQRAVGYYVVPNDDGLSANEKRPVDRSKGVIPVGRGMKDVQLLIVNAAREMAGIGEYGEIWIRSPHLARGYLNDEALTSEKFIQNPFASVQGDRVYRTGDIGRYMPDGNVEFVGRNDGQVKIRGFRIELAEIETVLRSHPCVRDAAVIARDTLAGDKRLVAYVVDNAEQPVKLAELRLFLKQKLPDYMMASAFVRLDELPMTPNRKLNRKALPEPVWDQPDSGGDFVGPRTPLEEVLSAIWAEVLGVESVSVQDDFFEAGGHSLLAARIVSRIRETFKLDVPLRRLFESPTVAGLSERIEGLLRSSMVSEQPPLSPVARGGSLGLSYDQQRLWLIDQLDPNPEAYNQIYAIRLSGPLKVAALEQALNEVIRRHEILRTTFERNGHGPAQRISPSLVIKARLVDMSRLPGDECEVVALRLIEEESRERFDLRAGPLMRATLIRLASRHHILGLCNHHIVSDGWSAGILLNEVATLYERYASGEISGLPELPIQYADYASWEREWMQGAVLDEHLSYWKAKLDGAPHRINLPAGVAEADLKSSQVTQAQLLLPQSTVDALNKVSHSQGASFFMTLMTALNIVLSRWTGQNDLVIGTVISNRPSAQLEKLIGCFINFLPLRCALSDRMTAAQALAQVRETTFEAYAHQACPFEKLVETISPARTTGQNPLFNVGLLAQNFPRTAALPDSLEANLMPVARQAALLDLRVVVFQTEGGAVVQCDCKAGLFDQSTLENFLASYILALDKMAAESDALISAFDLSDGLEAAVEDAKAEAEELLVAVAATFTAEPVESSLNFWMQELDIAHSINFAPYNQVFQELLDPASLLSSNAQGINVILIRLCDWRGSQANAVNAADLEEERKRMERSARDFSTALKEAANRSRAAFVVCICPDPPASSPGQASSFDYETIERSIADDLNKISSVYLVRQSELAAAYPVTNYYDEYADRAGHIPYTEAFFAAAGTMIARVIHAITMQPCKVIALDCDGTLWKGVCGEDGPLGVEIDAPRRFLQEFMVEQSEAGKLLCLCSRNNPEDVLSVFDHHPEMPLKLEHITSMRLNWGAKSDNLISISEELGLGLDSMIFVDDDPVICAQVEANCPEVLTIELPQQADAIPPFLKNIWAFDQLRTTEEDKKRTRLYAHNKAREDLREQSLSLDEFIKSLELRIVISPLAKSQAARVAQLTERTNQFNFTGRKYSEYEIERMCCEGQLECLVADVSDRFGDYGLVGVIVFEVCGDVIRVDTLLLSCRALGRGVEQRMLARLGEIAAARGLAAIEVCFVRTSKNQPAADFIDSIKGSLKRSEGAGWVYVIPANVAVSLCAER